MKQDENLEKRKLVGGHQKKLEESESPNRKHFQNTRLPNQKKLCDLFD